MMGSMVIRAVLGGMLGGAAGFAYYKFVGCSTGSCPLSSNPWISTLYGMTVGVLMAAR